jgi:hypothetical protein
MMIAATIKRTRMLFSAAAVGVCMSAAGLVFAGQHGESAPHRCTGCATGTCFAKINTYGHYATQWRRWPGATDYEGVRRPTPKVAVPDVIVPDEANEGRVERRTRSDKPIDSDFGSASPGLQIPSEVVSGADADGPSNPFENTVPNTDLPESNATDGFGGVDFGLEEPITPETPPAESNEGTFGPLDPANDLPDAPPFDDDQGADAPLFDFGLIPPPATHVDSERAVRSIKNRRPVMQRDDTPQVKSIPTEISEPRIDVPEYGTVGGSFSYADLMPPSQADATTRRAKKSLLIGPVTFEDSELNTLLPEPLPGIAQSVVEAKSMVSSATVVSSDETASQELREVEGIVVDRSANPLRQTRTSKKVALRESMETVPLVQESTIELKPVPKPDETSVSAPAVTSKSSAVTRSFASTSQRSLRNTLRKNPLR